MNDLIDWILRLLCILALMLFAAVIRAVFREPERFCNHTWQKKDSEKKIHIHCKNCSKEITEG